MSVQSFCHRPYNNFIVRCAQSVWAVNGIVSANDIVRPSASFIWEPMFQTGPPGIPVLEVKNSPLLRVKIPENSRFENTPYTSRE